MRLATRRGGRRRLLERRAGSVAAHPPPSVVGVVVARPRSDVQGWVGGVGRVRRRRCPSITALARSMTRRVERSLDELRRGEHDTSQATSGRAVCRHDAWRAWNSSRCEMTAEVAPDQPSQVLLAAPHAGSGGVMGKPFDNAETPEDKAPTGFPEPPGVDPGDNSQDESPHHVLNTPVGEPDPTESPDP